jgi:lipopolysaccharide transport system ATP-binding protein
VTGPVLELRAVGKRYRRGGATSLRQVLTQRSTGHHWVQVLHDIDLTVHHGDVIGVVGRNGGGKSTLLRVAAGLTNASTGAVFRRAEVSGLLTLNASASGDLSGADNAVTAAVLAGLTPRQARGKIAEIADFAELSEDVLREPLRTYSDGMKLRLAFAAAITTEPELLLIDEILAVGDLAFQEKCLDHIERLRDGGCALLVASHVMGHLRRLSTRGVWLRNGSVYAEGAADEVLDAYERSLDERAGAPREALGGGFRKGTGEVLIEGVSCVGTKDAPTGATTIGGGVTVTIAYRCHAPVPRGHFSISLRAIGGDTRVVDLTTEASGVGAVALTESGQVSITLDRLDLEPGAYWVDTGVYSVDWDVPYDYRWDAVRLLVQGAATSGLVQPPHRWSVGG